MSYECKVLADSRSEVGHRLTTVQVKFPRFILAEVNTHRMLSRNSASSRAIPTERLIEQVEKDPFVPETFHNRIKGMGVGEPLSPDAQADARQVWMEACIAAVNCAVRLKHIDKSRVNRLLEPYMWHTAIITATEWDNFFALRDHKDAQPEFRILAGLMLDVMRDSEPRQMLNDWWHLPLVTEEEFSSGVYRQANWEFLAMVSAGRCARVSFDRQGEYEPIADSHKRAKRLLESGHLSPLEHPAAPAMEGEYTANFRGWKQLRQTIPHEENLVGHKEGRPRWDLV